MCSPKPERRALIIFLLLPLVSACGGGDGNVDAARDPTEDVDSGTTEVTGYEDGSVPEDGLASDVDDAFDTIATLDGLTVIRLKGDAYTRGYMLGAAAGDKVVFVYEKLFLQSQLGYDPKYMELYREYHDKACSLLDYTEDERQQFQGLIDGMRDHWSLTATLADGTTVELGEGDLCIANALSDVAQIACSSVAAWGGMTADGETVVARNLDWDAGPDNVMGPMNAVVSETPEDESWTFVNVTVPGYFGCLSCMNGDGDAVFLHDTARWHDGLAFGFAPRGMTMRRALLAATGADDDLGAFEGVVESAGVVTGTNMVFVRPASQGESAAACFEADDNETHPDGFVTVRTDLDHEVNDTELSDVLFVTNHHRKRYAPSGCGRYEGMRDKVEAMAAAGGPALTLADLRQMMKDVEFQGGLVETFHTILFKPSDWTLTVLRIGPDHRASDDPGVTVPPEVLFPWGR